MKISFGADHAGFALKIALIEFAKSLGYETTDRGTNGSDSVDYPDYAQKVAQDVTRRIADFGVLICKTGVGMCISANKVHGIRAALCYSPEIARLSRLHNNANVLCLGASFTEPEAAKQIFQVWIETNFEGGRHEKRIEKMMNLES
ncbi:MAG: ribose 5-phosphate isomerase B [Candidatus Neomarinimicrobiota bacterium]